MENLKRVAILGLGVTGQTAKEYFANNGYEVLVWDEEKKLNPFTADFDYGSLSFALKSPGIPLNHNIITVLNNNNVNITTDVDIFIKKHLNSKIIAITGTDGKSTVAYYVYKILTAHGINAVLGGNFGYPLLHLEDAPIYVLELSSYQLASMQHEYNFFIGCITNIAYDHISYHGNMENYILAKERILSNAANKIIGTIDEFTAAIANKNPDAKICNGYNENIITAICSIFKIDKKETVEQIKCIPPLEHRTEVVIKNTQFTIINDSKATNLHATSYALNKFDNNIILILGGQTKGEDFSALSKYATKIKKIYLIGDAAEILARQIKDIPYEITNTLENTIKNLTLETGDVLLFSPACASFDQFNNFEHRGKEFKRLIHERFY